MDRKLYKNILDFIVHLIEDTSQCGGVPFNLKELSNELNIIVTKFITCYHKLQIKTEGKIQKRLFRICLFCNKNTLGYKYRYVVECRIFSFVRNKSIDEKYSTNVNTYKFGNVMNTIDSYSKVIL